MAMAGFVSQQFCWCWAGSGSKATKSEVPDQKDGAQTIWATPRFSKNRTETIYPPNAVKPIARTKAPWSASKICYHTQTNRDSLKQA